jgi:hypothetical protein
MVLFSNQIQSFAPSPGQSPPVAAARLTSLIAMTSGKNPRHRYMFRREVGGQIVGLSFAVDEQSSFDASALPRRSDAGEWIGRINRLMQQAQQRSSADARQFAEFLRSRGINPPPVPPAPPPAVARVQDPIGDAMLEPDVWGIDLGTGFEVGGEARGDIDWNWALDSVF